MKSLTYPNWLLSLTAIIWIAHSGGTSNAESATNRIEKVWGNPAAGYSISISTSKTTYSSGEPIDLKISIKNVGTNDLLTFSGYPVAVFDASTTFANTVILPTPEGKHWIDNIRMSGGSVCGQILKPGEEVVSPADYPLSMIYDLKPTGTYKVSVTRKLEDTQGRDIGMGSGENEIPFLKPPLEKVKLVWVTSNEIELVVKHPAK